MAKELLVTAAHIETAIESIAAGGTLVAVAKSLNLKPTTLYDAIQRDPTTAAMYARAQEVQAEVEVDEIKTIADDETKDPKAVRNMMEARKWRASKRNRARYGDKLDLTVQHTADVAGALADARSRLRPVCDQSQSIDAEVVEVKEVSKGRASDTESPAAPGELDIFAID